MAAAAATLSAGAMLLPQPVAAGAGPSSVIIGVDHTDLANQNPPAGRLFEYTDFFSRDVSVHRGEVVNFRTAPFAFHIIGLAKNEEKARAVYPIGNADTDDPNGGNGHPKLGLGSSNFTILNGSTEHPASGINKFDNPNGPPDCDPAAAPNCVNFTGGDQVQVAGVNSGPPPNGADWNVLIDAPTGTYHMFCYIHPGMSGTLHVVGSDGAATTQHQIDVASSAQFAHDRAAALDAEKDANVIRHSVDPPGHRTFFVQVGIGTEDNRVAIDEMLPNPQVTGPMQLTKGDKVKYLWRDPHNVHSVVFPATNNNVPPIGFDCEPGYSPGFCPSGAEKRTEAPYSPGFEVIFDPGTDPAGTLVTSPSQSVDSGVLVGTGYLVQPTFQTWSIRTNATTGSASYSFHCTIHDFMVGSFAVS